MGGGLIFAVVATAIATRHRAGSAIGPHSTETLEAIEAFGTGLGATEHAASAIAVSSGAARLFISSQSRAAMSRGLGNGPAPKTVTEVATEQGCRVAGDNMCGFASRPGIQTVVAPPWDDEKVQMEHRLVRVRARSIQDVHPSRSQGRPKAIAHSSNSDHDSRELGFTCVEEVSRMAPWDDKDVAVGKSTIRKWEEAKHVAVLIDKRRGSIAFDDLAEDAVVHSDQSASRNVT
jgi:hypothetical protein